VESDREKQKIFLENLTGVTKTITVLDDLQARRVLMIRNNKDVVFNLPVDLDPHLIIKVFIENCTGCTFNIGTTFVSQHLEIAHCTNVDVQLNCPIATVQVDLSESVRLFYGQNVFRLKDRVYHSAVKQLSVNVSGGPLAKQQETGLMDDFALGASSDSNKPADENQFVTQLDEGLVLRTDLVLRDAGNHPTTAREIEERKRELLNAMREKGVDPSSALGQKLLRAEDAMDAMRSATTNKNRGNELFKDNDYGQAIIHYSQAIVELEADLGRTHGEQTRRHQDDEEKGKASEANALLLSCYSNRAACALKLGQHENSLEDANKCIEMDKKHVKGLFRKGLSLHALGRYQEACPARGKALELDPTNKQIKTALQFAERKLAMQARGR
jgi:tetratricopeptide (TPR) repeat protein